MVKTHGMGENGWLLIKHKDIYAATSDITKKDKSVLSQKTVEQIKKSSDKVWKNGHQVNLEQMVKGIKGAEKTVSANFEKGDSTVGLAEKMTSDLKVLLKKGKKSKIPIGMKLMLATLVNEPFDDPGCVYELKWDGYRALGFCLKNGDVQLLSRNNKQFNDKFYPIFEFMQSWKMDMVVDGEILVINDKGISNLGRLQNWRSEADGELVYYVFDLIWYQGFDLTALPLSERQAILAAVLPQDDDRIRLNKVFKTKGLDFFDAARKMGLEGIIAKKAESLYLKNNRSAEWLKIKVHLRQEVVIAGFTKNDGTSKKVSSLLLGVYENGDLQYVGKVGTGFNDNDQREMMAQFKPLITDKIPFSQKPDVNKPSRFRPNPPNAKATWLKPELVCEVEFTELTSDGVFRHPSFQGMRMDKKPKEVVREAAVETKAIVQAEIPVEAETKPVQRDQHSSAIRPPKSTNRKTLLNPKDETQVRKVNGHELKFTHLSKLYWPEDEVSKRDMFNYYYQVADFILP